MVLTSIIGIFVFQSGEGAEEIVEHMQGMDHDLIHEHEEMAEKFIIISHLTGLFALLAFYLNWQKKQLAKLASIGMLFLLIIYIGLAAITANTGGVIHHPEMLDGKVQHTHDD